MKIYRVGGAIRDRLLGLPVHECDWMVVGATAQDMLDARFRPIDVDFPVFLHPKTGDEYALARTETKTGVGYKGFEIDSSPAITLEQDLARRDLTINAVAEDESGQLFDPFHGQIDLKARLLRHITPAFVEDPVRVLRIARFAAHLGALGFKVAPDTQALLQQMAHSSDLQSLQPERIWKEMRKALLEPQPWRFFEVLLECGALDYFIPELTAVIKDDDVALTPFEALGKAVEQSDELAVRFTVVIYPAARVAASVKVLCSRLRAEKACCDLLDLVIRLGPAFIAAETAEAGSLLQLLEKTKAQQNTKRFQNFLLACGVLWPNGAKVAVQRLTLALKGMNDVAANDLLAEGFQGAELGIALAQQRIQSIEKRLTSDVYD